MKTIKLSFLLLVFLLLTFIHISDIQSQGIKNKFYVGFQGAGLYTEYYQQYRNLNVNSTLDWGVESDYQDAYSPIRLYGGFFDSLFTRNPNNPGDPFHLLANGYMNSLRNVMQLFLSGVDPGKSIVKYRTVKVVRPAFGQRSNYQAEDIGTWNTRYPGYGYMHHDNNCGTNYNEHWRGESVSGRNVQVGRDNTGYIVDSLFENGEQSSVISRKDYGTAHYSDVKYYGQNGNTEAPYKWFVKPRMRIDTAIAHNPNYQNTLVATMEIYRYDGNKIKDVPILVKNFFHPDSVYNGIYVENYYFAIGTDLTITGEQLCVGADSTNYYSDEWSSKVDYRVKWNGLVNVWLDYVRLDDEWAHYLFTENLTTEMQDNQNRWKFHNKLKSEVENLVGTPGFSYFYFDEFYYNNIECLAKVNDLVKQYSTAMGHPTSMIIQAGSRSPDLKKEPSVGDQLNTLQSKGLMTDGFVFDMYPVYMDTPFPSNLNIVNQTYINSIFYTHASSVNQYNDHINTIISGDWYLNPFRQAGSILKSSTTNPIFISTVQMQSIETNAKYTNCVPNTNGYEFRREPTNEEINVQAYLMLCYGAKQIDFYNHTTVNDICASGEELYDWGVTEVTHTQQNDVRDPRISNYYGQNKFQNSADLNAKLLKIGRYMYDSLGLKFNDSRTFIREGLSGTYIDDIQSFSGTTQDPISPVDRRYWHFGFFNQNMTTEPNTYSKYLIAVNKSLTPVANGQGDVKELRIKFKASDLPIFNNWVIINPITNEVLGTFDKNAGTFASAGTFQPGEGKLLKITPVMMAGGNLISNESFSNIVFDCNGSVSGSNKNITIGEGVKINFKDSCGIFMSGGTFKCGSIAESLAPQKSVNFYSQNGMQWAGLSFMGTDTVIIQNTELKDIKALPEFNEGYGIELVNVKHINIDGTNLYNINSSAAGIHVYYATNLYMNPSINITSNTIKISTDANDGINITPYSWLTVTGYIYGNKIINTSSGGGRNGIYAFDLVGTPIKNNYIENFAYGTFTWYSSLDLYQNTVDTKNISNGWDLYGIVSEYNLSNAYESRLGGSNVLTTLDGRCVSLDAMDLNISDGNNIFQINDSLGYHLRGYYPTSDLGELNAKNNCFKIGTNSIDESAIRRLVTWSNGTTNVNFAFGSNCASSPNYCDYYLGGNSKDTVWIECAGGMGGGQKGNLETEMYSAPQENTYKLLYDSLSINMRKKQYDLASQKCIALLDNYADSVKTLNVVDKLYYTALARNKVSELKSYYESFIQSHPNNSKLIQRMFYYIQKSKAKLEQYESAMQGFQTIMNQFPTSFEGLAAKWDYMATQLLDSLHGHGGGEKDIVNEELLSEEQSHAILVNLVNDPLDKYDHKKFTKEDRKVIVNNIVNAFEDQKLIDTKKFKELEVKVIKNEANVMERKEFKTKSQLKEVVKPQNVSTITQHMNAVQGDIKKVFEVGKNTKPVDDKLTSVIPFEYKLNQNYPNPFNPTTKINYELKNTDFVSLKIYDLLGREIAELVNETKDAGRYTVDFNASKYMMASGIYFYRIKAGEFVDTKRMVLIK